MTTEKEKEPKVLSQYEDKWLGNKKIKIAQKTGEKTSGGVPLVNITYDDNTTDVYTLRMLEAAGVVTDMPQDLTEFRDKRVYGAVKGCLELLRDAGLRENELAYAVGKVEASLVENIRLANRIKWGIEKDGDETLFAVDKVIMSHKSTLKDVLK